MRPVLNTNDTCIYDKAYIISQKCMQTHLATIIIIEWGNLGGSELAYSPKRFGQDIIYFACIYYIKLTVCVCSLAAFAGVYSVGGV